MRRLLWLACLTPVLAGCGGSPAMNTNKMTDEEVRQMKEADKQIDDEERGGSGTATPAKGKAKAKPR